MPLDPIEILNDLIAAGWGDVPRTTIPPDWRNRKAPIVVPARTHAPEQERHFARRGRPLGVKDSVSRRIRKLDDLDARAARMRKRFVYERAAREQERRERQSRSRIAASQVRRFQLAADTAMDARQHPDILPSEVAL